MVLCHTHKNWNIWGLDIFNWLFFINVLTTELQIWITHEHLSLTVKLLLSYSTCKMQQLRCLFHPLISVVSINIAISAIHAHTDPGSQAQDKAEWLVSCMATNWACQQDEGHSTAVLWYYLHHFWLSFLNIWDRP